MKPILFVVALLTTFQIVLGEVSAEREFGTAFLGVSAELGMPSPRYSRRHHILHQGISLSVMKADGLDYTHQHGLNIALLSLIQENIGIGIALMHWVEKSVGLQVGVIATGATKGTGVQIGLITGWVLHSYHCTSEWTEYMNGLQLGVFNLAQKSRAQLGIYNHVADTGGVQLGFWNRCTLEDFSEPTGEVQIQLGIFNTISLEEFSEPTGEVQIQLGILNTISLPEHRRLRMENSPRKCKFWSFGFLNETSSGWFIPFSNFGL